MRSAALNEEWGYVGQVNSPRVHVTVRLQWGPHGTFSHVEFVGLDGRGIAGWRARRAPLGMSAYQYRLFCRSLFIAARDLLSGVVS
jgi:hypothetical protein